MTTGEDGVKLELSLPALHEDVHCLEIIWSHPLKLNIRSL